MMPRSNFHLPDEPTVSTQILLAGYTGTTGDGSHGGYESGPSSIGIVNDPLSTLLYSLALIKERVHQAESLVSLYASSSSFSGHQHSKFQVVPTSMIRNKVSTLVQELVSVSSSMMFTYQKISLSLDPNSGHTNPKIPFIGQRGLSQLVHSIPDLDRERNNDDAGQEHKHEEIVGSNMFESGDQSMSGWFGCSEGFTDVSLNYDNTTISTNDDQTGHYEMIIEMNAADLLAKYTHFCQVCNQGFKRDANLRMHMRAHDYEYKSKLKNSERDALASLSPLKMARRYSCPQDGCRWNRKHPKFQPLKSMICVKNHYKRSHCPKMYICNKCNQKEFSVVSDLRTHEKHCGALKWQCSCGTTFSRKDKLVGHVGLFRGHFPIIENHGFCGTL